MPADRVSPVAGIRALPIWRADAQGYTAWDDPVAVEAPLEFLLHHSAWGAEPVSFGTTMRTPGDDELLAVGLLYAEGVVSARDDIDAVESSTRRPNVVNVRLAGPAPDVQWPGRRFSAGSSCGVCGTTGLDAAIARAASTTITGSATLDIDVLLRLPEIMRREQSKFGATGGIHAAALFDLAGNLEGVAEDVGRHNAFDKLVGENFMAARLPLTDRAVILSGQFRTGAEGIARRRVRACRHRRPVEPGREPGDGGGSHVDRLLARDEMQRLRQPATPQVRSYLKPSLASAPVSQWEACAAPCVNQSRLDFTASMTFG